MARSRMTCDGCGAGIEKVAVKLFASPTHRHDEYTGHADLCDVCATSVLKIVKFQKRGKKPRRAKVA